MLGLDYSSGRPGGAAISSAGYSFVVRYLSGGGPGLPGKLLTAAEYADLQVHGISCATNWETTADRMLDGYAAGVSDAQAAAGVTSSLGIPVSRPIYFSCDMDATPADQATIDDYLCGVASVIGLSRVGIYGGFWPVSRALTNGTTVWAWQTGAWSPASDTEPDGHLIDPRAHIYQQVNSTATVNGVSCDINEALRPDFGQYPCLTISQEVLGMVAGTIPSGQTCTKLVMPIGPSVSQLVARGWLSLASSENGTAQVWVQGPGGGDKPVIDVTLTKDVRWWTELPDGTDQMTVLTDTPGSVGWCLELKPQ